MGDKVGSHGQTYVSPTCHERTTPAHPTTVPAPPRDRSSRTSLSSPPSLLLSRHPAHDRRLPDTVQRSPTCSLATRSAPTRRLTTRHASTRAPHSNPHRHRLLTPPLSPQPPPSPTPFLSLFS